MSKYTCLAPQSTHGFVDLGLTPLHQCGRFKTLSRVATAVALIFVILAPDIKNHLGEGFCFRGLAFDPIPIPDGCAHSDQRLPLLFLDPMCLVLVWRLFP
jgi:hypothetical protein